MQSVSYLWHGDHAVDTAKQIDTGTVFEDSDNAAEFFALMFDDWFEIATDTGVNVSKSVVAETVRKMSILAEAVTHTRRFIGVLANLLTIPYQRIIANAFALESGTTVQGGETMAFVGSTVRLQLNLRNYYGMAVDIYDVVLKIMDSNQTVIETITDLTRLSKGVFCFDYTVPAPTGGIADTDLVFEFAAVNTDGKPIVVRDKLKRKFV